MSKIRVLSAADVRSALPIGRCIEVIEQAMRAVSAGTVSLHPRTAGLLVDRSGYLGVMPGSLAEPAVFGAKVASILPINPSRGLPLITGFLVLFDHATGAPVAMLDGGEITALRTAAASAFATRLLSRKDAKTHGILGSGVQAESHARAILAVRPELEKTMIWGRNLLKSKSLAESLQRELGREFYAVPNASDAAGADIVTTVTAAKSPIIFGADVQKGAHVNLVGAHRANEREADSALMQAGRIFVDVLAAAMLEAGEILMAIQDGAIAAENITEIGVLADGGARGRHESRDITIYKSVGTIAQDLFAGHAALSRAIETGIGASVEL